MDLEALRRCRRFASAAVSLTAVALVMAKVRGPAPAGTADPTGALVIAFLMSLAAFISSWRKEHAMAEAGFAERQRQQLAALELSVKLAQLKAQRSEATAAESAPEHDAAESSSRPDRSGRDQSGRAHG